MRSRSLEVWTLVAASVELLLAGAAHLFASAGVCPTGGDSLLGCATLIRPRLLGLFGLFTVSQLAVVGAATTALLALLLVLGRLERRATRWAAGLLAAAAGFALGLQLLSPMATGRLCPLCLAIALAALASGALFALAAGRRHGVPMIGPIGVALVVLVGVGATSAGRGQAIAKEDAFRRVAVASAGETPAGPEVVVVVREGCIYCEALVLDGLGEPDVLEVLKRARAVRIIDEASPAGLRLSERGGVPLLIVRDTEGQERGRLLGVREASELRRWLVERLSSR